MMRAKGTVALFRCRSTLQLSRVHIAIRGRSTPQNHRSHRTAFAQPTAPTVPGLTQPLPPRFRVRAVTSSTAATAHVRQQPRPIDQSDSASDSRGMSRADLARRTILLRVFFFRFGSFFA